MKTNTISHTLALPQQHIFPSALKAVPRSANARTSQLASKESGLHGEALSIILRCCSREYGNRTFLLRPCSTPDRLCGVEAHLIFRMMDLCSPNPLRNTVRSKDILRTQDRQARALTEHCSSCSPEGSFWWKNPVQDLHGLSAFCCFPIHRLAFDLPS